MRRVPRTGAFSIATDALHQNVAHNGPRHSDAEIKTLVVDVMKR